MPVTINKETFESLINQDIQRLEKEMQPSPEREHIKTVLQWSINKIYKNENTEEN